MLFSQVQAFLMVLDTGSFTEAAFRLNVAQSSVSHSLSKLEKHLGVRLLQRDRSGVRLTPQGEALLPYFRNIRHGVDQLELAARQQQGEVSGKVKIGSFPSTSCRILPRAISALKQQHPQVEVLIFEGTASEVERWLDNHTVDLAFVELPTRSHFQLSAVFQDQLRLIVPHGHPLDVEGEIQLSQISPFPYVLSKFGCEPLIRQAFAQEGLTLDVVYEVRDITTLMALVEENIGVSLVPELLVPQATAALASVPVRPVIQREVALARHPEVVQTPQSRALAEQIFRVKPG